MKWRGHLMVDDYGIQSVVPAGVIELACLAHCRRKFFDLHVAGGRAVAEEALRRIGELYAVEAKARDGDEGGSPLALRQQEALPKLNALHDWLIDQRLKTADGSGLARAIDYSLKRWPALIRYVDSGAYPSTTIWSRTRSGRLPWGAQLALHRVGTRWPPCRRDSELARHRQTQRVGTYAWLKDTLELPTWPYSRIDELLPLRPITTA
ncbi:MAG: transposase [Propionivibrio sp.]|nr:transposase [Propionivibrio sp.]